MIFFKNKETEKKVNNLLKQLKYEYQFVFILAPTVRGFYPIIERLLINSNPTLEIGTDSIVYLTIASIAMILDEPSEKYKGIIDKIKEKELFYILKSTTEIIRIFKKIVDFFLKKSGKVLKDYYELFAYTALFVPFAATFSNIIKAGDLSFSDIFGAFSTDIGGKTISTSIGIGAFTVKHFLEDILNGLKSMVGHVKNFKDNRYKDINDIINKVKTKFIKESNILSFEDYNLLFN